MKTLIWILNFLLALTTLLALSAPYVSPAVIWWPAVLSIGFPVLVFCNVVFVAFWLISFDKKLLLSLLLLIISFPHFKSLFGFNHLSKGKQDEIKVTTYNFLGGGEVATGLLKKNRRNLAKFKNCIATDILGIQESPRYHVIKNAVFSTLDSVGLKHHYQDDTINISIHARYPLFKGELNYQFNASNGIISVLTQLPSGDTVKIIAVHLLSNRVKLNSLTSEIKDKNSKESYKQTKRLLSKYKNASIERAKEAELIGQLVKESKYPVILLGDFNEPPISYVIHSLKKYNLVDHFNSTGVGFGETFRSIPGLKIDYIFTTPDFKGVSSFVNDCYGLSDHEPLTTILKLKN